MLNDQRPEQKAILIDIDPFSSGNDPATKTMPNSRLTARFDNQKNVSYSGSRMPSSRSTTSSSRSSGDSLSSRSTMLTTSRSDKTTASSLSSSSSSSSVPTKVSFPLSADEEQYLQEFFTSKDINADIRGNKPIEVIQMLNSSKFQEREIVVKTLTKWIKGATDLPQGFMLLPIMLLPVAKSYVLRTYCLVVRKLLHDNVMKVQLETNVLLRALADSPAVSKPRQKDELNFNFERIILLLASKATDNNVRVRRDATRSLIKIAGIPAIQVNTMIIPCLVKTLPPRTAPKVWTGTLEMLRQFIAVCKIRPSGRIQLARTDIMEFLNKAIRNTNIAIRESAISTIVEVYKQIGKEATLRLLGTVKPVLANLLDHAFESYDESQQEIRHETSEECWNDREPISFEPSAITKELIVKTSFAKTSGMKQNGNASFETQLKVITHLNLNDCSITKINNIHHCDNLRVLYLYNNMIPNITGLEKLANITHLYLQNNSIRRLEGLGNLRLLSKLYLDSNSISRVEGLENLHRLEELYISFQDLQEGEHMTFDLASVRAVKDTLVVLHAMDNQVRDMTPLAELSRIEKLNVSKNLISDFEQSGLGKLLQSCTQIQELNISDNPVCRLDKYRAKVTLLASTSLVELDGAQILENQRRFVKNVLKKKLI